MAYSYKSFIGLKILYILVQVIFFYLCTSWDSSSREVWYIKNALLPSEKSIECVSCLRHCTRAKLHTNIKNYAIYSTSPPTVLNRFLYWIDKPLHLYNLSLGSFDFFILIFSIPYSHRPPPSFLSWFIPAPSPTVENAGEFIQTESLFEQIHHTIYVRSARTKLWRHLNSNPH